MPRRAAQPRRFRRRLMTLLLQRLQVAHFEALLPFGAMIYAAVRGRDRLAPVVGAARTARRVGPASSKRSN
jgi:hypothetical protein